MTFDEADALYVSDHELERLVRGQMPPITKDQETPMHEYKVGDRVEVHAQEVKPAMVKRDEKTRVILRTQSVIADAILRIRPGARVSVRYTDDFYVASVGWHVYTDDGTEARDLVLAFIQRDVVAVPVQEIERKILGGWPQLAPTEPSGGLAFEWQTDCKHERQGYDSLMRPGCLDCGKSDKEIRASRPRPPEPTLADFEELVPPFLALPKGWRWVADRCETRPFRDCDVSRVPHFVLTVLDENGREVLTRDWSVARPFRNISSGLRDMATDCAIEYARRSHSGPGRGRRR